MRESDNILLWAFLALEILLFTVTGALLIIKREKRALKVRSPKLLHISH